MSLGLIESAGSARVASHRRSEVDLRSEVVADALHGWVLPVCRKAEVSDQTL